MGAENGDESVEKSSLLPCLDLSGKSSLKAYRYDIGANPFVVSHVRYLEAPICRTPQPILTQRT